VNKGGDRAELLKAVETVVAGERYVSAAVARQIAIEEVMPTKSGPLSNREYEVLRAIAMGRTLTEIGRALALSVKTVSTHKRRLMKKLGVHNNTALIRRAVEEVLDDAETSQEQ
jgi:DNA-binding NarL/FixJ family response regulator